MMGGTHGQNDLFLCLVPNKDFRDDRQEKCLETVFQFTPPLKRNWDSDDGEKLPPSIVQNSEKIICTCTCKTHAYTASLLPAYMQVKGEEDKKVWNFSKILRNSGQKWKKALWESHSGEEESLITRERYLDSLMLLPSSTQAGRREEKEHAEERKSEKETAVPPSAIKMEIENESRKDGGQNGGGSGMIDPSAPHAICCDSIAPLWEAVRFLNWGPAPARVGRGDSPGAVSETGPRDPIFISFASSCHKMRERLRISFICFDEPLTFLETDAKVDWEAQKEVEQSVRGLCDI